MCEGHRLTALLYHIFPISVEPRNLQKALTEPIWTQLHDQGQTELDQSASLLCLTPTVCSASFQPDTREQRNALPGL